MTRRGMVKSRQAEETDRETWQAEIKTRLYAMLDAGYRHKPSISPSALQPDPTIAGLTLDADTLLSALAEPQFRFCCLRAGRG